MEHPKNKIGLNQTQQSTTGTTPASGKASSSSMSSHTMNNGDISSPSQKRVAIIGAGPSGLSQLAAFVAAKAKGAEIPDVVCFEKQNDWSGQWNYTWRTGLDEHGEPVHGSMYRNLWTNGPKECLEFADYSFDEHFGKATPSFPPREILQDYVVGRAERNDVRKYIQFNTAVRWVYEHEPTKKFMVVSEHLPKNHVVEQLFDYVVVCTGHFSFPHTPEFDGIDTFPGRVLHAHDFRSAEEFKGRDVLVIGASESAEDVALQCYKFGVESVTISYRTEPMDFKWPKAIEERPLLTRVQDNTVYFSDGTSKDFHAIVICTGYRHYFPFIEESLRLVCENVYYPPGLYKGVVWNDNPGIMYLGMQDQWYSFSFFDLQAWYARDLIMEKIELPDKPTRTKDLDKWLKRENDIRSCDPFDDMVTLDFQADHMKELAAATDYPKFDIDLTVKAFQEWNENKIRNILTYRDMPFKSSVTGTMATVHHTTWIEAIDASTETFLGTKDRTG